MSKRRNHDAGFKARVALEAVKGNIRCRNWPPKIRTANDLHWAQSGQRHDIRVYPAVTSHSAIACRNIWVDIDYL